MNVDIKVQVEALKTGNFRTVEHEDIIMMTQGNYIVYIEKNKFFLNTEKMKKFEGDCVSSYYPEEIEKNEYAAVETNKMLRMNNKQIAVGIERVDNHEMIWINEKFLKLFRKCTPSVYCVDCKNVGVIFKDEKMIKGFVLPVEIRWKGCD